MGRNNRDYKIKDKNLTENKKRGKFNKNLAFTLASMSALSASSMLLSYDKPANAMNNSQAIFKLSDYTKPSVSKLNVKKSSDNNAHKILKTNPENINSHKNK